MHTQSSANVASVDMSKHRLELFSDGIYAIILTLLVLDLKVPAGDGLLGLKQSAPSLLVHALTFFMLGGMWLTHHAVFALLTEINAKIIRLNLVGMFWITLIPFGARIASEEPMGTLGVFMITICYCFAGLALKPMASVMTKSSEMAFQPELRTYIVRRRRLININLVFIPLICPALIFVSPWFGYACLAWVSLFIFFTPTTPEYLQKIRKMIELAKASEPEAASGG
jgi:uncharacterized membrane protein